MSGGLGVWPVENLSGEGADAARIVDWRGGEAEHRIHPEGNLAKRKAVALGKLQCQPWAKQFKVFLRPMCCDGTGMMEIKGLDGAISQGDKSSLTILARHFARVN